MKLEHESRSKETTHLALSSRMYAVQRRKERERAKDARIIPPVVVGIGCPLICLTEISIVTLYGVDTIVRRKIDVRNDWY